MRPEEASILSSAIAARVPFNMFSVLAVDWEKHLVRRVFSTDVVNYPVGGEKKLMDTDWAAHVIGRGEVFFASTQQSMAAAFADYSLLSSLGLKFAMNVPIRQNGKTCITLNLLRETEAFTPYDGCEVLRVFGQWFSKLNSNQNQTT